MASWNVLADLDPLWTILSDPKKKFCRWDTTEFFDTGVREAKRALALCQSSGLTISYGTLLDFGCGVGRMTRAFSSSFKRSVGIDVSPGMIALARRFNVDRPNCEFIASDAPNLPFADQSFDFVFSVLVLQHVPTKKLILGYISEFIRVTKDSGIIVFQLTDKVPFRQRIQGRRRLWSLLSSIGVPQVWLFNKLDLNPIRMNGIQRKTVEEFVYRNGGHLQAVERYDQVEGPYHSYYYVALKRSSTCLSTAPQVDNQ